MAVDLDLSSMNPTAPQLPPLTPPAVTRAVDPARQPSLDPAASLYTPLSLAPVDPGQGLSAALPKQQEPSPLGAVTKGGAIAYMLDKVFRGAIQGHDAAIASSVDQFNKKLAAQQGLHNIAAQNYFGLLQSGQGIERGPDGSPVIGPDGMATLNDAGKAAQNQVKASLEALQDSVNQRFPPPKKTVKQTSGGSSGSASGNGQPGSGSGPGPGNLISRISNHKNDPNDALTATIQGAQVAYQQRAQQYLNPAYQAQVSRAAGTAADTAAARGNSAALQAQLTGLQAKAAGMEDGPKKEGVLKQVDAIKELLSALPKESSTTKLYVAADGKDAGWYVPGHQPAGYQAKLPGSSPQVGSLSDFTKALYGDHPSPEQIIDAKNKYAPVSQTVGQHVVMQMQKDGSQLPVIVETTSSSSRQAGGGGGLPTARTDQGGGGGGGSSSSSSSGTTTGTPASAAAAPPATAVPTTVHPHVSGARVVSVGTQPVGGKLTADQSKELEAAETPRDQARTALNLLRQSMKERAAGQNVSLNDNDLVLAWNRAHTQRFNEAEINKINNLGGAVMKLEGNLARIVSGQLSDAQRMLFARNLTDELKVQQGNVDRIRKQAGLAPEGTAPPQAGKPAAAAATAATTSAATPAAIHKSLDNEIMRSLGH